MREKKVKRIANEINTYKHYLYINLKKKKKKKKKKGK